MKKIIGAILALGALIGIIIMVISTMIFQFQNPDMTETRVFIDYIFESGRIVPLVLMIIAGAVGVKLMD